MKVLVIDDDFHIQKIVEDRLKAENFDILKAADGIEGLRMVYDFRPDVVLLDIMMPTIDGHSVLLCIKKDDKIQNIPVIMLTAKREKTDVTQAITAGAADYIVKPIDFRMMIRKIYEAAHAVPPKPKEDVSAMPVNVKAMAEDLANLSFEMDAVAASAGVESELPPKRVGRVFDLKVETHDNVSVLKMIGPLRLEDVQSVRSELVRLIAAGVSHYVLDISQLQTLDIQETMLIKEILDYLALNQYQHRLLETDSKRRRFLRQCNMHLEHPVFSTQDEALHSLAT